MLNFNDNNPYLPMTYPAAFSWSRTSSRNSSTSWISLYLFQFFFLFLFTRFRRLISELFPSRPELKDRNPGWDAAMRLCFLAAAMMVKKEEEKWGRRLYVCGLDSWIFNWVTWALQRGSGNPKCGPCPLGCISVINVDLP